VDQSLIQLYQSLQKLMGLHRQLLETVRQERIALVDADLPSIETITQTKQSLVEEIHRAEAIRLKLLSELATAWRKSAPDLTLQNLIIEIQGTNLKTADQFRSALNTLTILVQRISDQNQDNRKLIERSLEHIHQMRQNALGSAAPKSNTYTPQGQRAQGLPGSRILSKEA
jgi:flagellar biosynthesis/type III secretory pathway chaperone